MSLRVDTLTVDSHDPRALAGFWAEALGYGVNPEGEDEFLIEDPSGKRDPILFQVVAEDKTIKNRWHLDLRPSGRRDDPARWTSCRGATPTYRIVPISPALPT